MLSLLKKERKKILLNENLICRGTRGGQFFLLPEKGKKKREEKGYYYFPRKKREVSGLTLTGSRFSEGKKKSLSSKKKGTTHKDLSFISEEGGKKKEGGSPLGKEEKKKACRLTFLWKRGIGGVRAWSPAPGHRMKGAFWKFERKKSPPPWGGGKGVQRPPTRCLLKVSARKKKEWICLFQLRTLLEGGEKTLPDSGSTGRKENTQRSNRKGNYLSLGETP